MSDNTSCAAYRERIRKLEDEYARLWQMYSDLEDERDRLHVALQRVLTRIEMHCRYDKVLHRQMEPYTTKARTALEQTGGE